MKLRAKYYLKFTLVFKLHQQLQQQQLQQQQQTHSLFTRTKWARRTKSRKKGKCNEKRGKISIFILFLLFLLLLLG